MRRFILFCLISLFLAVTPALASEAPQVNEVLLKFTPNTTLAVKNTVISQTESELGQQIRQEAQLEVASQLSKLGVVVFQVPQGQAHSVAFVLGRNKNVEFAEPNAIAQKMGTANDPSISQQWGLSKINAASDTGQSAWDITKGSTDIKTAVLDTGIFKDHSDLAGRVILEKDFTGSSNGPSDSDGHGTHVAGSIGAIANNNVGIAGVSYSVSILNGKVLDNTGSGTYANIASGIMWAADNGAKVINLSLGGSSASQTLKDAVDYATGKGSVVVAAAGNSGTQTVLYPANYPNVISVAATDSNDAKPSWSNYGNSIDVAAPGVSIYSTYKDGGYATYSGTSMATSYVSGAAVLVWSSGKCTTETCVDDLLQSTADQITGTGSLWKYGRINVYKAVLADSLPPTPTQTPTPTPSPTLSSALTPTLTLAPTSTPTPSTMPTPTLTPTPQPNPKMTVSNIELWTTKNFGLNDISLRVTVQDTTNNVPLNQSNVSVKLTTPTGASYTGSGSTNSQGQITFILRHQFQKGMYTGVVTGASKTGYIYIPSLTSKTITIQ